MTQRFPQERKSSVTQSVLGPLVEGLAPLPITVAASHRSLLTSVA
jgi:hypothetical protein